MLLQGDTLLITRCIEKVDVPFACNSGALIDKYVAKCGCIIGSWLDQASMALLTPVADSAGRSAVINVLEDKRTKQSRLLILIYERSLLPPEKRPIVSV